MSAEDQKLLKLAALALGGEYSYGNCADGTKTGFLEFGPEIEYWNPLDDDGDAFRLMVSLGIEVNRVNCMQKTICFYSRHREIIQFDEQSNCDPCASTRRAIVRAAAAIGEQLEGRL